MPVVGSNSKELGVRVPPNRHADISVDENGDVRLNGQGMSVAEHWTHMQPHLIPKRLLPICPDAIGSNALACFRMGEGQFSDGMLSNELELRMKSGKHSTGNVVPSRMMQLDVFQDALTVTREEWSIDETAT